MKRFFLTRLHPFWISLAYLALYLLALYFGLRSRGSPYDFSPWFVSAACNLALVVLSLLWAFETATIAADKSRLALLRLFFSLPAFVIAVLTLLIGALDPAQRATADQLSMQPTTIIGLAAMVLVPAGALLFFSALWISARELRRAESGNVSWTDIFGTFLLIVYLPFGVWLLTPRVRRLMAALS